MSLSMTKLELGSSVSFRHPGLHFGTSMPTFTLPSVSKNPLKSVLPESFTFDIWSLSSYATVPQAISYDPGLPSASILLGMLARMTLLST